MPMRPFGTGAMLRLTCCAQYPNHFVKNFISDTFNTDPLPPLEGSDAQVCALPVRRPCPLKPAFIRTP
jgi:hypothetical protein